MAKCEKCDSKPFRSITDLKGYSDDTCIKEPSLTDPEQDEPISRLVARMLRGEMVATKQVYYDEIGPETAPAEAFAQQSVVERDGFDLSDSVAVMAAAEAAAAALASPPKPVPPPADKPAAEPQLPSSSEGDGK